jgi:hypothetical protein
MHFVVEQQKRRRKAATTMRSWRWKLLDQDGTLRAEGSSPYASVGACERAIVRFKELVSSSQVTDGDAPSN